MILRALLLGVAMCGSLAVQTCADSVQDNGDDLMRRPPWESCRYCHGPAAVDGVPPIPVIDGQDVGYLIKQLEDYRAGRRHDPSMMMGSAMLLLEQRDEPEVAHYFNRHPTSETTSDTDQYLGARLYREGANGVMACASCHGLPDPPPGYPRLTGQTRAYLAQQMRAFRDGTRTNDPGHLMQAAARSLTPAQTRAVVDYLGIR